ncbi:hypothetical protein CCUS01_07780 [Colletotrichum cuscutae]|uniref:Uncharacterized protein n=1 Tax=Colletotrichum cuscutae TaxID=1209917 RepID=A0AAI9V0D7_9PEZI|nr:hypothetical protein CCUS01_07780 [Colletotrichum cuscutae]
MLRILPHVPPLLSDHRMGVKEKQRCGRNSNDTQQGNKRKHREIKPRSIRSPTIFRS